MRRGCVDRLYWSPGTFDIQRCNRCKVLLTNPWPVPNELAAYYPDDYISFVVQNRARTRLARALRGVLRAPYVLRYGPVDTTPRPSKPGERILDVGCGSGAYLQRMQRLGWDVHGIEPSPAAALAARNLLGVSNDRIVVGVAGEIDWPAETFHLVTLAHVLEHLPGPKQMLVEIWRWLRPGGRVRIWVPNIDSVESKVFRSFWFGLDVPRHLVHYSRPRVMSLLDETGFDVERIVPEYQGSSLSGSLWHLGNAISRQRRRYHHSQSLYYAALPFASAFLGMGSWPTIDVTAVKR